MTEITRARRAPKAIALGAATALALSSCTGGGGGEVSPSPSPTSTETRPQGNDAIIKRFRQVAEKAVAILVQPPEKVRSATRQKLRNEVFDAAFGPQNTWELEIYTHAQQQLDRPTADDVREVSLFTGPPLPSLNDTKSLGSLTLTLNDTRDAIGGSIGKKGSPLEDGTTPLVVTQANTLGQPLAAKTLLGPKGEIICQQTFATNAFDDMYLTMNHALDAMQRGEPPIVAFPPGPFVGTHNPEGFCPQ